MVSIEAENYTNAINNQDIKWQVISGLGRTNSGVTAIPVTKKIEKPGKNSPVLEYNFYLLENPKDGKVKVNIYLSPTLNFQNGTGLKYAISIDDEEPQIINMHQGCDIPDWKYPQWWNQAVSDNIIIKTSEHRYYKTGRSYIKVLVGRSWHCNSKNSD